LAGAMLATTVRDQEIDPAKSVLKAKTAETRAEIAELLRTQGVAAGNLARMGL